MKDKDHKFETAGSLTPELEGIPRSMTHKRRGLHPSPDQSKTAAGKEK